ncbi:uncharacterized protein LOC109076152 isoform X1 [Cyprinus carpio]|uniref:Uncharacterized protein LOC109076152 isoform X1 n=1 Tax=Cyprinus carpio TaxID=7962 RepID=A0A9R0AUC0_CYPCA|nr:uncharacterized protein LOC109076152 isoform X1 [Cyprinus carpio]XP_042611107.1 uncharacterized protein LOC109076152 isoform X1 [Cyprinus carpio]XP_042611108.1 uncharacterized protein LOC109076152 isoform X1 [Cyprinus carpio]
MRMSERALDEDEHQLNTSLNCSGDTQLQTPGPSAERLQVQRHELRLLPEFSAVCHDVLQFCMLLIYHRGSGCASSITPGSAGFRRTRLKDSRSGNSLQSSSENEAQSSEPRPWSSSSLNLKHPGPDRRRPLQQQQERGTPLKHRFIFRLPLRFDLAYTVI